MQKIWINIPRKPLKLILNEYSKFSPKSVFLRQKVMSRSLLVNVNKGDLEELFQRMPTRLPGHIAKAKNEIQTLIRK